MPPNDWRNQRTKIQYPTQVRIPPELRQQVLVIARKNNTTMSAIIRYQLEKFVKDYKKNGGTTAPTLFD